MSDEHSQTTGSSVGYFYAWQRGNELPELDTIDGLRITAAADHSAVAEIGSIDATEFARRVSAGNQAYVAWLGEIPCATGWSAWRVAEIGELEMAFILPSGEHYLWDFVTLPEQRGQGIYPHMLQAIIRAESDRAKRFWIGHDLENEPSRSGILKAGFTTLGEVKLTNEGPVFAVYRQSESVDTAARMLGLPIVNIDQT